jgi:hypothetical protein
MCSRLCGSVGNEASDDSKMTKHGGAERKMNAKEFDVYIEAIKCLSLDYGDAVLSVGSKSETAVIAFVACVMSETLVKGSY